MKPHALYSYFCAHDIMCICACLFLTGCNLNDEQPPHKNLGFMDMDASDGVQTPLSIKILEPAQSQVYTNSTVSFHIEARGDHATVSLMVRDMLRDEATLKTVVEDLKVPYNYMWNTDLFVESRYQLFARITRGKEVIESDPITVVVDRTPPLVTSTQPVDAHDLGAQRDKPIRISFDDIIDDSSWVDKVSLKDESGADIPVDIAIDNSNQVLELTPTSTLDLEKTYTYTLKKGVRDVAGNASTQEFTNSLFFNSYAQITTLDVGGGYHSPFSLARGPKGAVYLAYLQCNTANDQGECKDNNLFVSSYQDSSLLKINELPVDINPDHLIGQPNLIVSEEGNPVVTFVEYSRNLSSTTSKSTASITVRSWDGRKWNTLGNAIVPKSMDASVFGSPALTKDAQGRLLLAWISAAPVGGKNVHLHISQYEAKNNSWVSFGVNGTIPTPEPTLIPNNLHLLSDSKGHIYAVFEQGRTTQVMKYQEGWNKINLTPVRNAYMLKDVLMYHDSLYMVQGSADPVAGNIDIYDGVHWSGFQNSTIATFETMAINDTHAYTMTQSKMGYRIMDRNDGTYLLHGTSFGGIEVKHARMLIDKTNVPLLFAQTSTNTKGEIRILRPN